MDDDNQPTAWEDINPTRTALVAQPEPRYELSPTQRARLTPATPDEFQAELTACLALCGATGMTEDDRCEWLRSARLTLEGIPADLLAHGCRMARETCDHPSKVVPAIVAATKADWNRRRAERAEIRSQLALPPPTRHLLDRRGEAMSDEECEELNQILERIGATTRYRPDGSRTHVEPQAGRREPDKPRRKPTREDYIALGVDPSILDQIEAQ